MKILYTKNPFWQINPYKFCQIIKIRVNPMRSSIIMRLWYGPLFHFSFFLFHVPFFLFFFVSYVSYSLFSLPFSYFSTPLPFPFLLFLFHYSYSLFCILFSTFSSISLSPFSIPFFLLSSPCFIIPFTLFPLYLSMCDSRVARSNLKPPLYQKYFIIESLCIDNLNAYYSICRHLLINNFLNFNETLIKTSNKN